MPPIKLNKFAVLAGTLAVIEAINCHRLKKDLQLVSTAFSVAYTTNQDLKEKYKYLCHIIDENEIEISEFDLIVLTQDLSIEQ